LKSRSKGAKAFFLYLLYFLYFRSRLRSFGLKNRDLRMATRLRLSLVLSFLYFLSLLYLQ